MKLQKAIRTVAAVGVGAAMLGASALGALAAADLSSYPAPFIQNGTFNGQIVVGTAASTSDVIGAIGIATSLQAAAVKEVPVGSSGSGNQTVVTGGALVASGSNRLNYGENVSSVKSFFDQNDLTALQSTSVTGKDGSTYNMQFRVEAPNAPLTYGTFGTETTPNLFVDFNSASYNDTIQFPTAVPLQTLAGKAVTLFGRDYTVGSVNELTNTTKLTLYDAGVDKTFNAGDQVTVNVGGTSFDVEVMGVTSGTPSQAAVSINGDQQQVQAGNTYTFAGQTVYVKQVIAYSQLSSAGTNGAVELFLGSNKITLEDTGSHNAPVTIGNDNTAIPGTAVTFAGSSTKTTSITVTVTPSQDSVYGLSAGDTYTDPVFKELKWQFTGVTPGLMDSSRDVVSLVPTGTNQMNLQWTNNFGTAYNVPFLLATSGSNASFSYGTGLHQDYVVAANFQHNSTASSDLYQLYQGNRFFVSNNQYSRILQVQSIQPYNNKVTFSDVGSGESFTATQTGTVTETSALQYSNANGASSTSTYPVVQLTIDGANYDFVLNNASLSTPFIVTKSGSTMPATSFTTQKGAEVALNGAFSASSSTLLTLTEGGQYTQDKSGSGAGSVNLTVNVNGYNPTSGKAFTAATPAASGGLGTGTDQSNSDLTNYVDPWGTFIQENTNSNSGWVKLYFPDRAMTANLYLAPAGAGTSVTGGEGSTMSQQVQKINVGAAVLDSEADSMVGHANLLVVGGPCANTVAAALMGNPAAGHCADGFEPGKGMIKVFDNNGYESILVAGYESAETRLASQVLANYQDHKAELQGKEVIVEQTSANTVSITAPAVSSGNATGNSTA